MIRKTYILFVYLRSNKNDGRFITPAGCPQDVYSSGCSSYLCEIFFSDFLPKKVFIEATSIAKSSALFYISKCSFKKKHLAERSNVLNASAFTINSL